MISTKNEWDPLEKIIVGTADHANWPNQDPVFAQESEKTTWRNSMPGLTITATRIPG
jgi:hypothetical protein